MRERKEDRSEVPRRGIRNGVRHTWADAPALGGGWKGAEGGSSSTVKQRHVEQQGMLRETTNVKQEGCVYHHNCTQYTHSGSVSRAPYKEIALSRRHDTTTL